MPCFLAVVSLESGDKNITVSSFGCSGLLKIYIIYSMIRFKKRVLLTLSFCMAAAFLSFSDLSGLHLVMLLGVWNSLNWGSGEVTSCSYVADFLCWSLVFLCKRVRMSKFSSSRKMFFFWRLWDTIFSCFLIGFDLLSIFWSVHWTKLVWHLESIFILRSA